MRLAVCVVGLLSVLTSSAWAIPVFDACPNATGVICRWVMDTPFRGRFQVIHPATVSDFPDLAFGEAGASFVSPTGFWKVTFTLFRALDFGDASFDVVDVAGTMQHIKRPPPPKLGDDDHKVDADLGGLFGFSVSWASNMPNPGRNIQESANIRHGEEGHIDHFLANLLVASGGGDIKGYSFLVDGIHPNFIHTPPPVSLPATLTLVASALVAWAWKARRRSIRDPR